MPRFRLTAVLKLREQTRDERRRDLAQAFEAERILQSRLSAIQAELAELRDRTRDSSGHGTLDIESLLNARRYQMIIKSQISEVETQLRQVLAEVERRRAALVEADRDVKTLEKLQDRQAQQLAAAEMKREAKQLDEAAVRGFLRQEAAS